MTEIETIDIYPKSKLSLKGTNGPSWIKIAKPNCNPIQNLKSNTF